MDPNLVPDPDLVPLLSPGPVDLAEWLNSGRLDRLPLDRVIRLAKYSVAAFHEASAKGDYPTASAWGQVNAAIQRLVERVARAQLGAIRRRPPTGECQWCGDDVGPRFLFCSPAHRQAEYRCRLRHYGELPTTPTEWRCEHCGADLGELSDGLDKPLRSDARYCSGAHRVAAHRAR